MNQTTASHTVPSGRRPVVLLVDDEPAVRNLLTRCLERSGYKVLAAENGLDALGYALWPGQRIDLVITDVTMPVLSGHEFVEQLHEAQPDMPVLYVSGYPQAVAELPASPGGTHFLLKPFTPAELTAVIRHVLQHASFVSAA